MTAGMVAKAERPKSKIDPPLLCIWRLLSGSIPGFWCVLVRILVIKVIKAEEKKQRVSWVLEALAGSVQSAGFQVQREAREQTQVTHSLR